MSELWQRFPGYYTTIEIFAYVKQYEYFFNSIV